MLVEERRDLDRHWRIEESGEEMYFLLRDIYDAVKYGYLELYLEKRGLKMFQSIMNYVERDENESEK